MTTEEYNISRYDNAVMLLPYGLRERARTLPRHDRVTAEEIRLRVDRPPSVLLPEGEITLGGESVRRRDLESLVELATEASVQSVRDEIKNGYITVRGGYRIGLCGSAVLTDGHISGIRAYSSAALRISREVRGIADSVMPSLIRDGKFLSTLIIAPPGAGKTTLLRDIIAYISGEKTGSRVALADERGEVAAMSDGAAGMNVGSHTDVLDCCPKADAMMMLLRSMNPEVIAADEITAPEDIGAIRIVRNCGVSLLATAHGTDVNDLRERPLYRELFADSVFERYLIIRKRRGERVYEVIRGEDV